MRQIPDTLSHNKQLLFCSHQYNTFPATGHVLPALFSSSIHYPRSAIPGPIARDKLRIMNSMIAMMTSVLVKKMTTLACNW